jgi:hypothetical protein
VLEASSLLVAEEAADLVELRDGGTGSAGPRSSNVSSLEVR